MRLLPFANAFLHISKLSCCEQRFGFVAMVLHESLFEGCRSKRYPEIGLYVVLLYAYAIVISQTEIVFEPSQGLVRRPSATSERPRRYPFRLRFLSCKPVLGCIEPLRCRGRLPCDTNAKLRRCPLRRLRHSNTRFRARTRRQRCPVRRTCAAT